MKFIDLWDIPVFWTANLPLTALYQFPPDSNTNTKTNGKKSNEHSNIIQYCLHAHLMIVNDE